MYASLECSACLYRSELADIYACPRCGGTLDIVYDHAAIRADNAFAETWKGNRPAIERFAALLPLGHPERAVTLGEGSTPLVRSVRLAERLGMRSLYFKLEGSNPTGSFKDRQMAVALSRALEFGRDRFATVSSGNAGNALAAYAARAGMPAYVWVSLETAASKRLQIQVYGARLFELPSPSADGGPDPYFQAFKDLRQVAADKGWVPMITARAVNPYMVEGAKAIGYEIAAELGTAPDVVFSPLGGGGLLGALHKGFSDLVELGLAKARPRLHGGQRKAYFAPADQLDDPRFQSGYYLPLDGKWAFNAITESGGRLSRLEDEAIRKAQAVLAESEGIFAEPHGAYSTAALLAAAEDGWLDREATTVCIVSGFGLKDMQAAEHIVSTYGAHPVRRVSSLQTSLDE